MNKKVVKTVQASIYQFVYIPVFRCSTEVQTIQSVQRQKESRKNPCSRILVFLFIHYRICKNIGFFHQNFMFSRVDGLTCLDYRRTPEDGNVNNPVCGCLHKYTVLIPFLFILLYSSYTLQYCVLRCLTLLHNFFWVRFGARYDTKNTV